MKGNVIPVVGSKFILTPKWIKNWSNIIIVDPNKTNLKLLFFSSDIFLKIIYENNKKIAINNNIITKPNSSDIAEIT